MIEGMNLLDVQHWIGQGVTPWNQGQVRRVVERISV